MALIEKDRQFYKALRADIEHALVQVRVNHGLRALELVNLVIDAMGDIRVPLNGVTGDGASPEESAYNTTRKYSAHALPALGQEVVIRGQRWRVVGQKLRGNQRIIVEKLPQGGRFLLPVASFEKQFGLKAAPQEV